VVSAPGERSTAELLAAQERPTERPMGCLDDGEEVIRLAPEEREVLLAVRDRGRPLPLACSSPVGESAKRLADKGLLVLIWTSSDGRFDYFRPTRLGLQVADVVGAP
jgi:hypothetical protein